MRSRCFRVLLVWTYVFRKARLDVSASLSGPRLSKYADHVWIPMARARLSVG